MDHKEIAWDSMDRIDLAAADRDKWWALLNMVLNLRAPFNEENLLSS